MDKSVRSSFRRQSNYMNNLKREEKKRHERIKKEKKKLEQMRKEIRRKEYENNRIIYDLMYSVSFEKDSDKEEVEPLDIITGKYVVYL